MGYNLIDTDETDSNVDKEITVDAINGADMSAAAAGDALLSDGNGNLTFGSVGAVEEVSTFANLPALDPPQLAYITDEEKYYYSKPISPDPFNISSASFDTSINTQDVNAQGIAWNDDGSRLYEVGSTSDNIYQYTVSSGGWEAL